MARPWTEKRLTPVNPPQEEPKQRLKASPRIMIAEDHAEMRALLRQVLVREGYQVIEAEDGPSLIRALIGGMLAEPTVPPDLIITDMRMPGCTGLEVLARLRREDRCTPFILITAFGDEALHEEATRLGASVLDKPFAPQDLRALVQRLIQHT
ncbi:response regulator [Stigmatella aurantiaca]|uniref:Response regulator n=2 Tax=Stigmatella aurantiaca (strain DW4/3-1) TaxID=378806 RepID=E3FET5_STIAD|nr:response regulator [Stigmatella aurantiaca]ADO68916.1 Response regulator [Stigmatella aurantiaca DW4/3-1]